MASLLSELEAHVKAFMDAPSLTDPLALGVIAGAIFIVLVFVVVSSQASPAQPKAKKSKKHKKKKAKNAQAESGAKKPTAAGAVDGEGKKLSRKQRRRQNQKMKKEAESVAKAEEDKQAAKAGKKKRHRKKNLTQEEAARANANPNANPKSTNTSLQKDIEDGWEVVTSKPKKTKSKASSNQQDAKKGSQRVGGAFQEKIEVEPKFYGLLIGPKGSVLKKLMEGSGTSIQIPGRDTEGGQKAGPVIISGPSKENCKVAKDNILNLVRKGFCKLTDPDKHEGSIAVPLKYHYILIGPGGCNIRAIQTKTNVKVIMPRQNGPVKSQRVHIVGTKKDIRTAKEVIKSLMKYQWSNVTHEGQVYAEIAVPREKHGMLVGPRGATIKHIQGATKAKVNIPALEDENQNVVVVGVPRAVQLAKAAIQKIVAAEPKALPKRTQEDDTRDQGPDYDDREVTLDAETQGQYEVDSYAQGAGAEDEGQWGAQDLEAEDTW